VPQESIGRWLLVRCKLSQLRWYKILGNSGFIVTNLGLPSRAVIQYYNKRGNAELWIKKGKQAVNMTPLSCHRFRSNQSAAVAERHRQ
jgi:hypothetical protein